MWATTWAIPSICTFANLALVIVVRVVRMSPSEHIAKAALVMLFGLVPGLFVPLVGYGHDAVISASDSARCWPQPRCPPWAARRRHCTAGCRHECASTRSSAPSEGGIAPGVPPPGRTGRSVSAAVLDCVVIGAGFAGCSERPCRACALRPQRPGTAGGRVRRRRSMVSWIESGGRGSAPATSKCTNWSGRLASNWLARVGGPSLLIRSQGSVMRSQQSSGHGRTLSPSRPPIWGKAWCGSADSRNERSRPGRGRQPTRPGWHSHCRAGSRRMRTPAAQHDFASALSSVLGAVSSGVELGDALQASNTGIDLEAFAAGGGLKLRRVVGGDASTDRSPGRSGQRDGFSWTPW